MGKYPVSIFAVSILGLIMSVGCAAVKLTNRGTFEKNGYRMMVEVLPDEGFVPLDAFIHVVLEVPEDDYHRYRGCFKLRIRYGPDDESTIQQNCEKYDPDARPNEMGRIVIEYSTEHRFDVPDLYQIVVVVRPGSSDDSRTLISGSVSLAVKQRVRYGMP